MYKIYIGQQDKQKIVNDYLANHDIEKVYVFGDDLGIGENISFADLIEYKYYYRLLQEVNAKSLVIINECLRRTNRYELTYNCIRRYLMNKPHRIIFNYLPIKENEEDFAILHDFSIDNPFLKDKYEWITDFSNVEVGEVEIDIQVQQITVDEKWLPLYEEEKEKIFNSSYKNPQTIPQKALTFSENVSRNYIKKFDSKRTFKPKMNIVVNQLKVDTYYYEKIMKIKENVNASLQRLQGR